MAGVEFAERTRELRPTVVNAILKEVDALKQSGREPKSLMRGEPDFPFFNAGCAKKVPPRLSATGHHTGNPSIA